MPMRSLRSAALALLFSLAACAGPQLPYTEFRDQILVHLAREKTDRFLAAQKTEIEKRARDGAALTDLAQGLSTLFGQKLIGVGFGALNQLDQSTYRAAIVSLEAQRVQLEERILDLYIDRIRATKNGYAVCSDGKDRRYQVAGRTFRRVEDGPGPCPLTDLRSLYQGDPIP